VLSVLVALKVVEFILMAAAIVASAICAACTGWCGACSAALLLWGGYEYTASIRSEVEPVVHAIVSATNAVGEGVKIGMPIAAETKVMMIGADTYREPTRVGFMVPAGLSPEDWWLPVEQDDSGLLCQKAGEHAADHAGPAMRGMPWQAFFSTSIGSVAGAMADTFCGESADKGFKVLDDIELGDDRFQLRAIMYGEPPFDRNETRVAVATWGDRDAGVDYGALQELGRFGIAQAEYYYHDSDVDRKEWLWNMRWRARLRRTRLPESIRSIIPDALRDVENAMVH
jgi:hypothetical protein